MEAKLAPPPRAVPFTLRLVVMLGGVLPLLGWIVLGVGLLLTSLLLPHVEPLSGDPFVDAVTVRGKITNVAATSTRVASRRVHAVHFQWTDSDGVARDGVSYGSAPLPEIGSDAAIEVSPGSPPLARVAGFRAFLLPAAANLVLLIPIVGALLLLGGAWRGHRLVRLLQDGLPGRGRLVDRKKTNTAVRGRRVEVLTFAFTDGEGRQRTARVRSHRLADVLDEAEEPLLYAPDADRAALLDDLPARPRWNERGEFEPAPFAQLALVLIAPTLVVVVHRLASSVAASFG